MNDKIYNKTNFHRHTFCVFKEVKLEQLIGLKPNYNSKSGSSYYFTSDGVYRVSNHWGRAANCKWRLQSLEEVSSDRTRAGYANWNEFHTDNDLQKLYFIEVDFDSNSVNYNHIGNQTEIQAMLRTASETTKRIKQIRLLFKSDDWAKHLDYDDFESLRKHIIQQLISTDKSLQEIKKALFL
ncbi:hypothetical protein ACI6PS_10015 [Flavobacterium sp. PLA-1-15]|uniref:hypothetical protein n=1 Tax=Flavobacterium sp. PLA-1-15 TaxID=3380533 RepID=UPI003B808248